MSDTISVPAGSLVITGYAPGYTVYGIPAGSLVITGQTPTLGMKQPVPAGGLVLAGYAPAYNVFGIPTEGLTITANAPTGVQGSYEWRKRVPYKVQGQHISLRFRHNTAGEAFYLNQVKVPVKISERPMGKKYRAIGCHIRLRFRHCTAGEAFYLLNAKIKIKVRELR